MRPVARAKKRTVRRTASEYSRPKRSTHDPPPRPAAVAPCRGILMVARGTLTTGGGGGAIFGRTAGTGALSAEPAGGWTCGRGGGGGSRASFGFVGMGWAAPDALAAGIRVENVAAEDAALLADPRVPGFPCPAFSSMSLSAAAAFSSMCLSAAASRRNALSASFPPGARPDAALEVFVDNAGPPPRRDLKHAGADPHPQACNMPGLHAP